MKTTRDTLLDAAYQYLLDHTIPTEKGPAVSFLLIPKNTLKKRILAREKGFKRIHEEEIVKNISDYRQKLPYVKAAKKTVERLQKNQWKSIARSKMIKQGNFVEKVVLKIEYKCKKFITTRLEKYKN